jgi:predicted MPP superfamily phosphohydrolase
MLQPFFTRRRVLQLLCGLSLTGIAGFAYARRVEPHWIDVERVGLQVPGLPDRLAGKRIVQLSDIHLSDFMGPEQLAEAVTIINQLAPDWLFLTGDYVSDIATAATGLVEPLRRVNAPIYGVYGNHDYWADSQVVTSMLETAGVCILRNTATPLAEGLWLAGVDDMWGGRPDLKEAIRSVPGGVTTLLLIHEPDFFDHVLHRQAPIAVQFSGHSHGGQVRLPTLRRGPDGLSTYAPLLPKYGQRYPIGLRCVGDQQVYTNRGLGVWPLPYRINCRPEITLFTLAPAAGAILSQS